MILRLGKTWKIPDSNAEYFLVPRVWLMSSNSHSGTISSLQCGISHDDTTNFTVKIMMKSWFL